MTNIVLMTLDQARDLAARYPKDEVWSVYAVTVDARLEPLGYVTGLLYHGEAHTAACNQWRTRTRASAPSSALHVTLTATDSHILRFNRART